MFVASAREEPSGQDWQSEEGPGLQSVGVRRLRSWRNQKVCVSHCEPVRHLGLASDDRVIQGVQRSGPGWICLGDWLRGHRVR